MAHIAAMSILPSLVKLPYDPAKDFAPITLCAIAPNLLVVHPSLQVTTVKGRIQLGRTRPGELRFASSGSGSLQHLAGELFKLQTKIDMLHVPYKGSGQAVVDLIAGHVHLNFDSVPAVLAHVKAGKLRALAVTSQKRFSLLPAVPAVAESGVSGFDVSTWWGLVMPSGATKDVVAKIHEATLKLLQQAEVRQTMSTVGAEIATSSPDGFAEFIRVEGVKYGRLIRDASIKLD